MTAPFIQLHFSFFEKSEKLPDYIKFYSVWQYDRRKFRRILNAEVKNRPPDSIDELKKIQKKALKGSLIKDGNNKPIKIYKENHIFRYKTFYCLCHEIYNLLKKKNLLNIKGIKIFEERYTAEKYSYYGQEFKGQKFEDFSAEIIGTEYMPIADRIKIHIEFLRKLRKDLGNNG